MLILRPEVVSNARGECAQVDRLPLQREVARTEPLHIEEVVQQRLELPRAPARVADHLLSLLRGKIVEVPLEQPGGAEDERQRRPQLVRDGAQVGVLPLVLLAEELPRL